MKPCPVTFRQTSEVSSKNIATLGCGQDFGSLVRVIWSLPDSSFDLVRNHSDATPDLAVRFVVR